MSFKGITLIKGHCRAVEHCEHCGCITAAAAVQVHLSTTLFPGTNWIRLIRLVRCTRWRFLIDCSMITGVKENQISSRTNCAGVVSSPDASSQLYITASDREPAGPVSFFFREKQAGFGRKFGRDAPGSPLPLHHPPFHKQPTATSNTLSPDSRFVFWQNLLETEL